MSRLQIAGWCSLGVLLLVLEGAWFWWLPLSLLHLLWLPVLYARRRWVVHAGIPLLALLEWLVGRVPPGAALSLAATVLFAFHLVREDVDTEQPVAALLILPAIEVTRHFWIAVYASLHGTGAVPGFPWLHTVIEALAGLLLLRWLLVRRRRFRVAAFAESTRW